MFIAVRARFRSSGEILSGYQKAAVFTDKGIEKAGLLDEPVKYMKEAGVDIVILDELPSEPTYAQAQKVIDEFKASGADVIVGIGGGSVLDIAKLSSVAASEEYGVKELLDEPLLGKKKTDTILIPTTAGTGSEATPNSIVAVPEKGIEGGHCESGNDCGLCDSGWEHDKKASFADCGSNGDRCNGPCGGMLYLQQS